MLTAQDTIRSTNIEIRKEFLLSKDRKEETIKRVEMGEKKYEEMWLQCKKRYENITYVKKWFEASNETKVLSERVGFLERENDNIKKEIIKKELSLQELDQKRVIDVAKFLIKERPKILQDIDAKKKELEQLSLKHKIVKNKEDVTILKNLKEKGKMSNSIILMDGDWPNLCANSSEDQDILKMPNLRVNKNDLDFLTINLEQIKKVCTAPLKRTDSNVSIECLIRTPKLDAGNNYTSLFSKSYLTKDETTADGKDNTSQSYAKKKLINILDDISVNKNEVKSIIAAVNPNTMKEINMISKIAEDVTKAEIRDIHNEEKVDVITSNNILIPPTQFSDLSQAKSLCTPKKSDVRERDEDRTSAIKIDELKNSQGSYQKKKNVSFDLPTIEEFPEHDKDEQTVATIDDEEQNVTDTEQFEASAVSDDFDKMKQMILKKHNFDLSPDFVYAKNKNLGIEEKAITSKFFNNNENNKIMKADKDEKRATLKSNNKVDEEYGHGGMIDSVKTMVCDNQNDANTNNVMDVSSKEEDQGNKSVSGFLFTHGPNGIPESLDVSISTTGFEEGDFPHGIDNSILLSPKGDLNMTEAENNAAISSQEVPNFLSGLRKTGFSFFGDSTQSDANPSHGNNFNFNFGSSEKKSRGGLFSMFH